MPAAEQREAVQYVLGEGAASLEPYAEPAVVERVAVYGGYRALDRVQAGLVSDLMTGSTVALLESQKRVDPSAYSPMDFGRDLTAGVWGDLKSAPPTRRALQRGSMTAAQTLLQGWAKGGADEEAQAKGVMAVMPMPGTAAPAPEGDSPGPRRDLVRRSHRRRPDRRLRPPALGRRALPDIGCRTSRECKAGVMRRGRDGTATVELRGANGTVRNVLFVEGQPAASDSAQPMTSSRQGDRVTVRFGSDERYDVPDALLSGG